MSSRHVIEGVLHNFLGTFTSRHSDFYGYWLFGFLVENGDQVRIDLLDARAETLDATPSAFAKQLAAQKFAEQVTKAGLLKSRFRAAHLDIAKSSDSKLGLVNGRSCLGHDVRFLAHAEMDSGRSCDAMLFVFVAPYDPEVELRSTRVSGPAGPSGAKRE